MKNLIFIALTLMLSMVTMDATAQSFIKKIGKAVEKEVTTEVKSRINKDTDKTKEKSEKQEVREVQVQQPQTQKETATANTAVDVKSNGEKKFVKNINTYYKIGDVKENVKLYYNGSSYYIVNGKGKEYKLIPCDAVYNKKKYYFYYVDDFSKIEFLT